MKTPNACFQPFLCSASRCCPNKNVARAYRSFGTALRRLEDGASRERKREPSLIRRLWDPIKKRSTGAGTVGLAPHLKLEDNGVVGDQHADARWPRLPKAQQNVKSCREFHERYKAVPRGQTELTEKIQVRGRIWSFRTAGNKLAFVDIMQDNVKVQVVCNYQDLEMTGVGPDQFKQFVDGLKRGDILSVTGHPHRTSRNELSVLISELPLLLSSCLRPLPVELKNEESRMRLRHVDLLIRPQAAQILKLGSEIKKFLRDYLESEGHISVKTPVLADAAGGAVAKPFYTKGFEGRNMALRIAPELWLKRLIMGGFERVYEIGPSFRNEGIDMLHNPEFETCEFYRTYTDLEDLIAMTESMFQLMSTKVNIIERVDFTPPYARLDFIPAIEQELGCELPHLTDPGTDPIRVLITMMQDRFIGIPEKPTLPRLLDKLCSHYLEPQCHAPTWIINHPECLSPLSKSFTHERSGQIVSARAELFVHKQEIVNTYEEENSPIAQREKFIKQIHYNNAEDIDEKLDESYLEALEYGMPPTGGWGCGIDRLTMLFGGTKRIADTLAFGTLKNVVALASHERQPIPPSPPGKKSDGSHEPNSGGSPRDQRNEKTLKYGVPGENALLY